MTPRVLLISFVLTVGPTTAYGQHMKDPLLRAY